MIRTKIFNGCDLDNAMEDLEAYCEDAKLCIDNIVSIDVVGKNADKEISVAMIYDDLEDD